MTKSQAVLKLSEACAENDEIDRPRALAGKIHDALMFGVTKSFIKQVLREELVPFSTLWASTQDRLNS